nr:hypothetical protein [Tanacetum cinerariifolium]
MIRLRQRKREFEGGDIIKLSSGTVHTGAILVWSALGLIRSVRVRWSFVFVFTQRVFVRSPRDQVRVTCSVSVHCSRSGNQEKLGYE